jgi:hypothetical protein
MLHTTKESYSSSYQHGLGLEGMPLHCLPDLSGPIKQVLTDHPNRHLLCCWRLPNVTKQAGGLVMFDVCHACARLSTACMFMFMSTLHTCQTE